MAMRILYPFDIAGQTEFRWVVGRAKARQRRARQEDAPSPEFTLDLM